MRLEHALTHRADFHASAQSLADFTGTWINELGSTMTLTVNTDGSVTGSYTSAVGDTNTYPLQGQAAANTIVFTVAFDATGSLTAWAGHYNPNTVAIDTLWHLVAQPDQGELWDATLAGFDTFTPS